MQKSSNSTNDKKICSKSRFEKNLADQKMIDDRIANIKHKIVIISGKGGVGKSTVSANLAMSLHLSGKKVGILDVDIHGPSIPHLFGLTGKTISIDKDNFYPVVIENGLKIMSMAFFLHSQKDAIIWRGPMKYSVIKQLLMMVDWGELDFLVIDSPPGTGDEPLSIIQLIGGLKGAVIVTTPQELSIIDVEKSITFCRQLNLKIIGLIENMSGFICPHCNKNVDIFGKSGGENLAEKINIPFLGKIPFDTDIVRFSDSGKLYVSNFPESITATVFNTSILPILLDDTKT